MKKALDNFYKGLEDLKTIGNDVADKRKMVDEELINFKEMCHQIDISQMGFNSKEIQENFNKHLDAIKNKVSQWEQQCLKLSEEEKFRDELKNSFIVIIYGKVKAGKSTLGNFVAKNCLESQKPRFIVYDQVGNENQEEGLSEFKTNITECTSSIQLFTLGGKDEGGGISWVDTPGLLSMTKENGDLAKKYIEAADYIIFPTSSDAPLQNDEIEQIRNLVNSGKNSCIRLLITKSDQTIEDEEDGKIVKKLLNKTAENRAKQENDNRKRIEEAIPNLKLDENILSLSVLTAQKGLDENDEALFQGSNMIQFYESMDLVLKEKAARLKKESPFKRLQGFLEGILGKTQNDISVEQIRKDYDALKRLIEEKKKTNENIKRNLKNEASIIISKELNKEASGIDENNAQEIFGRIQKNIEERIQEEIHKEMESLLDDFMMRFDIVAPTLDTEVKAINKPYEKVKKRNFFEKFVNKVSFGLLCGEQTTTAYTKIGTNKDEIIEKIAPCYKSIAIR